MRTVVATATVALGLFAFVWIGCEDESTSVEGPGASSGQTPEGTGAGCLPTPPAGFPYQPGCCEHMVAIPEVAEAGFDTGVLGAAPAPDHVHVSWAADTSTTFTANWRTDNATTATQLLYGTDQAAVASAEGAGGEVSLVTGHHFLYGSLLDGENRTRIHEVHTCGLEPGTVYYYKVGGPGAWSAVYDVATGPEIGASAPIRFAVAGDSRNDPTIFAQIQEAILGQGAELQLFTGDAVATGQSQADWNALFEATTGSFTTEEGLARIPMMVVNGNHESLAIGLIAQFAMPQDLSETELAQGEEWYSFDYGNAHFVALNDTPESTGLGTAQLDWLEADLAAVDREKTPWVFAMHHRSTYSCGGSHGSDLDLRAGWQPIFDAHKVDIVFSGHDHLYERSRPIRGLTGTDPVLAEATMDDAAPVAESGTIYVVTGGAGAPLYDIDASCNHTFVTEKTRNYAVVELDGRSMSFTAYRLDGTVLDSFEYTK